MRGALDYGIDSPAIVAGELLGGAATSALAAVLRARHAPRLLGIPLWGPLLAVGVYLLLGAGGMIVYSTVGKRYIRDRLLRAMRWHGDEMVLDVGCGRGLLLVGAAKRLTTGKAVGVDVWSPGAITGNRPEAALRNARREGVAGRVELCEGDARSLPFADGAFDMVVSNFVLHEMDSRADRERMLCEIVRVLKPGGQLALVDFIFTGEAARFLRTSGVADAENRPIGGAYYWFSALITLGLARLYQISGSKPAVA